jgi:hypothetical protein
MIIILDNIISVVYATLHCLIVVQDIYSMKISQQMQNPRNFGTILSLCIDNKHTWLAAITSPGYITIWDLRYSILLYSWSIGSPSTQVLDCTIHQTKGNGQWLILAVRNSNILIHKSVSVLVEVWDIQSQSIKEIFLDQVESGFNLDAITLNTTVSTKNNFGLCLGDVDKSLYLQVKSSSPAISNNSIISMTFQVSYSYLSIKLDYILIILIGYSTIHIYMWI